MHAKPTSLMDAYQTPFYFDLLAKDIGSDPESRQPHLWERGNIFIAKELCMDG